MAEIENKAQWSESRVKLLRECTYAYFLNYYRSWGGWQSNASLESRQAYTLKKMTNLPMWAGAIVHDTIQQVIESYRASGCKQAMLLGEAEEMAIQRLRRGWLESTKRAWQNNPSKAVNLAEHYYNQPVEKDATDRFKAKVLRCLRAFYKSELYKRITSLKPEDFLSMEEFQSFELNTGEPVAVKIDFAYRWEGKVHLLDWKTGRAQESVVDQLVTYAMYAMKKGWAKRVSDIVIVPVYLDAENGAVFSELTPNIEHTARQASIIRRETKMLLEAHANQNDPDKFPRTDDPRRCERCNFRGICPGARKEIPDGETPF